MVIISLIARSSSSVSWFPSFPPNYTVRESLHERLRPDCDEFARLGENVSEFCLLLALTSLNDHSGLVCYGFVPKEVRISLLFGISKIYSYL